MLIEILILFSIQCPCFSPFPVLRSAEGVCCRSLFGLFCADLEDRGLARTLWHCRGARTQLAPQILLPLACPPALVPLPVGHAHESVAQQLQMPSLQQGGTRWRPARKEVRRTVKLHCPRPPLLLHCMSMEYPDFGQRASSSTDSLNRRRVSLTCCWVADGADFAHSNASRHVSFKAHMSLTASIRSLGSTLQPTKN